MATTPAVVRASKAVPGKPKPDRRFLLLIVVIGLVYLATSTWSPPYNVDTYTNVLQAHAFAADGSPIVADSDHLLEDKYHGQVVLLVESADGPTSQYPPGVAIWGSLFYLLDTSTTVVDAVWTPPDGPPETVRLAVPSLAPAALAAVVSTTLAMLFLGLTLRRRMSETAMLLCVATAAFGTGAWSVASDQLWQHSPALMLIALGVYLASTDRFVGSGLAFAACVVIRPHLAVIAAAIGIVVAWRRRSWAPVIKMGSASALGLLVVVAYNAAVWGEASISGGYGGVFRDRVQSPSLIVLGSRLWEGLADLDHGVLVSSPFLALAFLALIGRTRHAPDWAVGAALGGAIYIVIQFQANRVSGGNNIFGYRYPLEPLMAAAPLLAMATVDVLTRSTKLTPDPGETRLLTRRRWIAAVLIALSVAAHAYGAILVTA